MVLHAPSLEKVNNSNFGIKISFLLSIVVEEPVLNKMPYIYPMLLAPSLEKRNIYG